MEWQENYNVGVEVVDQAHRKLFSIVKRLAEIVAQKDKKKNKRACVEGIKYFKSYTLEHFAQEEGYMRTIAYSGYPKHKELHEELKNITIPALEAELEREDFSDEAVSHFIGTCLAWLTVHIMVEDQAITGKVASRVHHHEKEGGAIKQLANIISEVTEETFDFQAALVSSYYSGGELNDPACFMFVYEEDTASADGVKRVFMAFEKPFIYYAVGGMMGMQFSEMNSIVINTMEQIIKANVKRVGMRTGEMVYMSDARDSDIITMDQLEEIYKKEPPRYSLLFRTEKGNFSFAMDL